MMYWILLSVAVILLAVLSQLQLEYDPEIVKRSVVLAGSPTEVYRYVSDMKLYAKWFPTVYAYESLDERALGVGKQYTQFSYIPWLGQRRHTIMIIDYDPPKFLAYIEDSWNLPKVEISLERVNNKHTRLTWTLRSRWRSYLFKYLFAQVLNFVYDAHVKHAMLNLRALFHS